MDRSCNLLGNKSPFSPRSRQNTTSKRSIAPAFRKSSRLSVSGRSTQAVQVVLKTQQNTAERFGQPLPVLVTEALTFAERSTVVSARISSECGYAWLVCGRRLLIWQYKQTQAGVGTPRRVAGIANQCYELQLPQSDLAHRAELVSVFLSSGSTLPPPPSCIAASPEGVVRYWPAVAHEGMSLEQQVDLQGQECDSLTAVDGLGCILATTTCTVVLVQVAEAPRHSLVCRTLKMPSGWLGGISKRMSSFIFGPISTETATETRLVRVLSVPAADVESTWNIHVLAGHSLQKWKLSTHEPEAFVYATDLTRLVKEGFFATFWENCGGGDQNDVESWVLDLQPHAGGIVTLLAAAVNMHISPQIHYALINLDTSQSGPAPAQLASFNVMKLSAIYSEEKPADSLGYRLLVAGSSSYIYNHRCITVVRPHEDPDCLEFNAPQDFLLGGSICINAPVFFSRNFGLVVISASDSINDLNNASMLSAGTPLETSGCDAAAHIDDNLSLYSFNPDELRAAYKDTLPQLQAAFVYHVQNEITERDDTIANIFAFDDNHLPGIDSALDRVVVSMSNKMLDDIPANDPRWGDCSVGLGSSHAMQVGQQLESKQKAYSLFVQFLRDADLWPKLGAVMMRGTALSTALVLAENSEKIVAAMALKARPLDDIVQRAVELAISCDGAPSGENGLTNQNLFYCRLTKFQNVIVEMVQHCDGAAHSDMNPGEVAMLIKRTNEIVLDVLKRVVGHRQTNAELYASHSMGSCAPECLPWTAATGSEGLMDSLVLLQHLTFHYGAKATAAAADFHLLRTLYEQFVSLVDIVLDARQSHLESIAEGPNKHVMLKQYASDRKRFIDPLIDEGQWEGAALLAEKYLDFESLIRICEATGNQSRLDTYLSRFEEQHFPDFVYNWYLQHNKQAKLVELSGRSKAAVDFLSAHPTLAWIRSACDKDYAAASATLNRLALAECDSLKRQKTMLSMAKLAALADRKSDAELAHIDLRLDVIACQEELPDYVLQQYGYDTLKPPVLQPQDLIHLYTCQEYRDATELDFRKSLELLPHVADEELRNDLFIGIWKDAILRDSWDDANLDSPLQILQNKLMFKLVDLALASGADPKTLLPPIHALLNHPQLVDFQTNKSFEYLIRSGYEHFSKVLLLD